MIVDQDSSCHNVCLDSRVTLTQGVDKVSRLELGHVSNHHRQQGIAERLVYIKKCNHTLD